MNFKHYDVVIVGAGAAGLAAAIGLARAGFHVAAIEAAPYPGAENWSGCVYFCESLAHPDLLGPEGVETLAWERRLVERGFFLTDGHGLFGMTYRDPDAFQNCYTVLRPVFDHHLSQIARTYGVTLLTNTTVESLIREDGRVIGACTNRGAVYADLVYLAEGDASHLVTKEGYERFTDPRRSPKFLQGIKQVLEFPPHELDKRFHIDNEEGVAYEMVLRNGTLKGKDVHLNAGGFLYTNKQSLSVGLVLPADNLQEHFGGDPNLLMEWFENLPSVQPWFQGAKRGAFGAKLIRGGGAREIPTLVDHGLAVGGAATAVGIDFPYPNFTGPATAMGLALVRAAKQLRNEGLPFTKDNLSRCYVEPLKHNHYWQDVEFLSRWPGYVKKTKAFFGKNVDLALQTSYLWTRSNQWVLKRWSNWLRLMLRIAGPSKWNELRDDATELNQALRVKEVFPRLGFWQLMLDGCVNACRDFFRSPRANLPDAGTIKLHYSVAGGQEPSGLPPAASRRWFERFAPVLASAAKIVYSNNDVPLSRKLPQALQLLKRQINLWDVLQAGVLAVLGGLSTGFMIAWDRFRKGGGDDSVVEDDPQKDELAFRYSARVKSAGDLTQHLAGSTQKWEARLAHLEYNTIKESHIKVFWPTDLAKKDEVKKTGLWHVCPASVYEARQSPTGQLQIVVNHENCIKCETCWRTSDLVDWGRDGEHTFVYPVESDAVERLLAGMEKAAKVRPSPVCGADPWSSLIPASLEVLGETHSQLASLCHSLDRKLVEFEEALKEEPRIMGVDRGDYLHGLALYAQQLTVAIRDLLRKIAEEKEATRTDTTFRGVQELVEDAAKKAQARTSHISNGKLSWAAADGRQLRFHHLVGLMRWLGTEDTSGEPWAEWLKVERKLEGLDAFVLEWTSRLDDVLPSNVWRNLDRGQELSDDQNDVLLGLIRAIPQVNSDDLLNTLHTRIRKWVLAELGQRDPSLGYRVASHLWARDLLTLAGHDGDKEGLRWMSFVSIVEESPIASSLFVPAAHADTLVVLQGDQLSIVKSEECTQQGLTVQPVATLGFRGAGIANVSGNIHEPKESLTIDAEYLFRAYEILASPDITSMAFGMVDLLCRRAIGHATGRVQFPGLFHDEESRDAIGKFGAVKKLVAEIATHRYVIETLDQILSPTDLGPDTQERMGLIKAIVGELLGTAPGSVSYNAGQVFGGTGYSEDDLLAKYYRDAAAFRFLVRDNPSICRARGKTITQEWDHEADPLIGFTDEAKMFEQVAQRQALQTELDELRVHRAHIRRNVNEWVHGTKSDALPTSMTSEFMEELGRQDAYLFASKALLLRTHAKMEDGHNCETEVALLKVWLEYTGGVVADLERLIQRREIISVHGSTNSQFPGESITTYSEILEAPLEYNSGDFLCKPTDMITPRLVPEVIELDPQLAAKDVEIRTELQKHFGETRDGLVYERYIEREHRPDDSDVEFLRRNAYFRMPIPEAQGGKGSSKAEYYLLTTHSHRLADGAVSLTIQVNSSLGTTPVLVAWKKDLPKAEKELTPFVEDTTLQNDIEDKLTNLLGLFEKGDGRDIEKTFLALNEQLKKAVFKPTSLRVLGHSFGKHWQAASVEGQRFNLNGMQTALRAAMSCWKDVCSRAPEYLDELQRRRRAAELFLRWVSSGQISAFALTEPSAGSDTARVGTRAQLHSVPVDQAPDGTLSFVPRGSDQRRTMIDADRLVFEMHEDNGHNEYKAYYRWSEDAEPGPICFDEYDYQTDDLAKRRYYLKGFEKVYFTDVAQLRERNGSLWYDYWELHGAKMWITNGRICGIMCLYAKTEEGVTGFIVDRHCEGLVVGKDEEKLGQCGSPTNELSLQGVRVPRENVIGLEGRGQVSALETLNIGRAGIAMSAMCQMGSITDWSRKFAAENNVPTATASWRLESMEEIRFLSEAMSWDIIGRFEHKKTRSARTESAAAKMLVSELLHSLIESAEDIHGLAGQTQQHLVEKRKRDARVLNIYEGTNEIQRFFLLKDLAGEVVQRWSKEPPTADLTDVPKEIEQLEQLKCRLRSLAETILSRFGQQLWQNPNLQAGCFYLSEAIAWTVAADSTLYRYVWLVRRPTVEESPELEHVISVGRRAFVRCLVEARGRLDRFERALTSLERGLYDPTVRAANLLFQRTGNNNFLRASSSTITEPFSILVVVEPPIPGVPEPVVKNGRILADYLVIREEDRMALEVALRIRDQARGLCRMEIVAVGPWSTVPPLQDLLSLGVDRVRLLVPPNEGVSFDMASSALIRILKEEPSFDLILGGGSGTFGEEGTLAMLVGEALGTPHQGEVNTVEVRSTETERSVLLVANEAVNSRDLPATLTVIDGQPLRRFAIEGYIAGLSKHVETLPWPEEISSVPVQFALQSVGTPANDSKLPERLLPLEASHLLLDTVGAKSGGSYHATQNGTRTTAGLQVEEVSVPCFAPEAAFHPWTLAVISTDEAGHLESTAKITVEAAQFVSLVTQTPVALVVLIPSDKTHSREVVSEVASWNVPSIVLVPCENLNSRAFRRRIIQECWALQNPRVRAVVGEPWTEGVFSTLGARRLPKDRVWLRVAELDRQEGGLVVETLRLKGKVRSQQSIFNGTDGVWWVSLASDAQVGAMSPAPPVHTQVQLWKPDFERMFNQDDIQRLLEEVRQAADVIRLTDAEFIVDVGFGVGNRDGYENVITPLVETLKELRVRGLIVGGSRKVTEELHLLPVDRQIGQSGVNVNPQVLLAIGVSGAPQHLNYIGPRATIIAFNRDPEAPIMVLNQRQAEPRVYPVVGDLFQTVPAFTAGLRVNGE